jgi:hypothetical protein
MQLSLGISVQGPVASHLLGPHISSRSIFSDGFRLCFSINMGDQVSHPYKTKGEITFRKMLTLYA